MREGPKGKEPRAPAVGWHDESHRRHNQWNQDQPVNHRLFLQLLQVFRANRGKFQADMVDEYAHDEYAREQIEQHADLNEERQRSQQENSKKKYPILQKEITKNLHDGFSTAGKHEKAGPHGGQ